jgi:hypothetical protein
VAQRVYIETTIPSYYYDDRAKSSLRRQMTRTWRDKCRINYRLCTSEAVLTELEAGNHRLRMEKLALLREVELLELADPVLELTEAYIRDL